MLSIYKKELRAFFSNATGYIVIGIFLLLAGLFLWLIPGGYNVIDSGYAHVNGLFALAPWLFLFLCPAVTMRLFAEEKLAGTWELLVTRPISRGQLVMGKFLAGWTLVSVALMPTVIYFISVWCMAEPIGHVDAGAFWGSFIGLLFLSAVYVAIGTFASSLSPNQVTAFIIAAALCFALYYGPELAGGLSSDGITIHLLDRLGIHAHYKSMSRGVLDSRDMTYFLLTTALFVGATVWRTRKP